jgi:transforming growth factor-beta-induced protein
VKLTHLLVLTSTFGLLLSSCSETSSATNSGGVVAALRSFEPSSGATFRTFADALEATGLAETIGESQKSYTIFAPADKAFAALPEAEREALLDDEAQLASLLEYHILEGNSFTEGALFKLAPNGLFTLGDDRLALTFGGETNENNPGSGPQEVRVDGVPLHLPDLVNQENFIVHGMEAVLTPSE